MKKKDNKKCQKKEKCEMAKVHVGFVNDKENSGHLKKAKGRTIPVLINTNSDASGLLSASVEKHARHFKQFNKFTDYVLLYSDMSEVRFLPGTSMPFTLEKYKADLLKPYCKLYFWLCSKEDFENTACESSDDEDLCTPAFSDSFTSSAPATLCQSLITTSLLSNNSTSTVTSCSSSATVSSPSITFPSHKASTVDACQKKDTEHQCPTCFGQFSLRKIESHADTCADAWLDPNGDCDITLVCSGEENEQEDEEQRDQNPTDISSMQEIDLTAINATVSHLKSLNSSTATNRIWVRRRSTFNDYMEARKKKWFQPKGMLKVTFVGEPAADQGGPRREFFTGKYCVAKITLILV